MPRCSPGRRSPSPSTSRRRSCSIPRPEGASDMRSDPDILIVGAGMGGSALAYALKDTGLRIHVLERGGYLPREAQHSSVDAVFRQKRYRSVDVWTDEKGQPFNPGIHYYVGGNTKVYGATMMRLRERDFEDLEHDGGVSPAWPVTYADLEPYYTRAEIMMGTRGETGADPTEPPHSGAYPHAPIPHDPGIANLVRGLEGRGLHPFPLPVSIQQGGGGACVRCMTCDGFPCPYDAKGDAENRCLRPALLSGNVVLETDAKVLRILISPDGRSVTGVEVEAPGEVSIRRAPIVVLAAGAINSAALLLRSATDRHPRGLANGSDQVGRNYMAHINSGVIAISQTPNETKFQKTLGVNDYYWGAEDSSLPLGHIQMLAKSDRDILRAGAPWFAPGLALDYMAKHAIDFWLTSEDLPHPDNRVSVDRQGRIHLAKTYHNEEAHRRLLRKLKGLMGQLGCHQAIPSATILDQRIPLAGVAHQCGTVRFGEDSASSALGVDCRAHEVDNLYVVDTSFFPSSSAVNPALTAMANALRVGDHLLERLGARAAAVANGNHDLHLQETS